MSGLFTTRLVLNRILWQLCLMQLFLFWTHNSSKLPVASLNISAKNSLQPHEDFGPFSWAFMWKCGRHAPLHINAGFHTCSIVLSWTRPTGCAYRPNFSRSLSSVFCTALLLAAGDIELNPGPQVSRNTDINFGYININSAAHKSAQIHDILSNFQLDILALSETRFLSSTHNAIKTDIAPAGYLVHHTPRHPNAIHPSGGGLALLHRDDIVVKPHPLAVSIAPSSFELQLLRITSVKPSITVVNAYRPPSLSTSQFHDELTDVLSAVSAATTDRLLLCGDLNCPGVDAVSVADELSDVIDTFGLQQHVREPTRYSPDHLLDVLATDPALCLRNVRVDDAGLVSDHRLVVATLVVDAAKHNPPVVFTYRRIKNIDTADFEQRLYDSPLFSSPATTVDSFADQMQQVIVSTLDEVAPLRRCVRRPSKAITKFLSDDAIEAKRLRRRLERRWLVTRAETDRAAYRRSCRLANSAINASRQHHFREQLNNAATAKDRWRVAKELLHSTTTTHNRTLDELNNLCNLFSNFFVDKISTLKRTICATAATLTDLGLVFPDPVYAGTQLDILSPVTVPEVYKLITNIQPKTSSVDYIPTSLIKSCPLVFSEIICSLANLSFTAGVFPSKLKSAVVTPLIKKAGMDVEIPSNFRPISNLNNISKILERLFLARLQPQVFSSPNFNSLQSAYRPHHSTETALQFSLNNIYQSADNSQPTLLASLDLSAAFDTIDHSTLLSRLETSFGVSGSALSWLSSYLSNRTQTVRIGQSSSSIANLVSGVPQGSVLGPVLFSIYISPIGQIVSGHGISHQQYADDTQLYISLSKSNPAIGISQLETCLSSLHSWFCHNGLCLNPTKSDAIIFGTQQRLHHFTNIPAINIAGSVVNLSNKITTLGVTLDSNLNFNSHVSSVCKTSYYHLQALKHIRSVLTQDMAASVAVALVHSRLDYANSILYQTSASNIHKLQRVQNMAARLVINKKSVHSDFALSKLHWLPVSKRINFKIATITYKILHSEQPIYLKSLIKFEAPTRFLRSSSQHKLHQPRIHRTIGERAFSSASPTIWNNIPLSIRMAPSISDFKRHLKTLYFTN